MRRIRQTSKADSGSVLATMPDDPNIMTAAMKHRRYFTDADEAGLKSPHLVHSGFQGAEALAEGAGLGQKPCAIAGQHHPPAAPLEQRHAPVALQIGDHVADARLGIGQRLGRLGEAAGIGHLHEGLVLLDVGVHGSPLLVASYLIASCYENFSCEL